MPFTDCLWIRHSRRPLVDTSMRHDQLLVYNRLIRYYSRGSAPRGYRCPVFPSRWTEIRGSLVRSEGESHSDHDHSYLHVSLCLLVSYLACLSRPPADPLGTAVGQIVSPFLPRIRFGILLLAIITSATLPLAFAVLPKPPTPPSTRAVL